MNNNQFMSEAIKEAVKAKNINEVPVGVVIVRDNKIIAKAHNNNYSNSDCTAHAEMNALRIASCQIKNPRLDDCDIYVTLEPCLMCAAAISLARIRRVYYGLDDPKFGAYENNNIFIHYPSYHKPEIYSGISELKSLKLMQEFFRNKR